MTEIREGKFEGDDPFMIVRRWLDEAREFEPNDPNAAALATVSPSGIPNVRMVLIKSIEVDSFLFYTNYGSAKACEIEASGRAAFVLHWKSLRRQIRVRGKIEKSEGPEADKYFESRSLQSKLGAWASRQSKPLKSKSSFLAEAARLSVRFGTSHPSSGAVTEFGHWRLNSGQTASFDFMIGFAGPEPN